MGGRVALCLALVAMVGLGGGCAGASEPGACAVDCGSAPLVDAHDGAGADTQDGAGPGDGAGDVAVDAFLADVGAPLDAATDDAGDATPEVDAPAPDACVPDCAGRECGDDGCGGSCGVCVNACDPCGSRADPEPDPALCIEPQGVCAAVCCPICCDGLACGDDGCGGACGACGEGESCQDHSCVPDPDGDGVETGEDNCEDEANADQLDADADGLGDACDVDDDGDGVRDVRDNCPFAPNADQLDTDGDGTGDACQGDGDGDGSPEIGDNCPTANPYQADADGDGLGDACDPVCGEPGKYASCKHGLDQAACGAAGGTFGVDGLSKTPFCKCPTGDAGCPCNSQNDCEGACWAWDSGCESVLIGECTPMTLMFSCYCLVYAPGHGGSICVD